MNSAVWCDHVQFLVEDVHAAAQQLGERFGFQLLFSDIATAERRGATSRSVVFGQGEILLVLTEPLVPGRAADFVAAHGDGVARIGLRCADVRAAYAGAMAHGARVIEPPRWVDGDAVVAVVSGPAGVTHTLVQQRADARTVLLPGIGEIPRSMINPTPPPGGLCAIDHFAVCLPAGELAGALAHYRDGWGFSEIFAERVEVGARAMNSAVLASPGRGVVVTLIEPAGGEPGQVDGFLQRHGGAGVQHIAFACSDIVAAVDRLAARGVEFNQTPGRYHAELTGRVGGLRHPVGRLRELGVLADRDHGGALFQIFTRPTHKRGSYFHEIIERDGADAFGGNDTRQRVAAQPLGSQS